MYYIYNKQKLMFEKANISFNILLGIGAIIGLLIILGLTRTPKSNIQEISYEDKLIILNEFNEFSEERFFNKIKDLNFKFPHIVAAQAIQETGNYKSTIFLENNNLFGMKQARSRSTLAKGTNRNHAYYDSWQESLYDYALYYNSYLRKINSEEQYLDFLKQNYAEDTAYIERVKQIIIQYDLIEKFK